MKKNILVFLSYVLVAVLATLLTLFIGSQTGVLNYSKLDQLEDLISDRFIGDVDKTAIEDAAAGAMISALGDRWSYYIPAKEYASYQEQMNNAYVGIGVTVEQTENKSGIHILSVTPGGPAEKAGVQADDVILAVDGTSTLGQELDAIKEWIRGKAGTQVKLKLLRGGKELELSVTRAQIQTPVATYTMLPDGIGLVTIENFDARCAQETIAAMDALVEQGAEKLIFDVRYNPGGYKNELVKILDYILPEGCVLFHSEDYTGKVSKETSDAKCLDMPMAVLVNGSSYSAAEFFAAALSEYDKALVVGEKTSGKGYFQTTYQLKDGSAVGLSIGKYYTPKGVSLEKVGITPDREVPVDDETANAIYAGTLDPMKDPQILAAMEALKAS